MNNTKPLSTKLIHAYTQMLKRIRHSLQKMDKLAEENKLEQRVEDALEEAKQIAIHLGELTEAEAELLATYLKRDLSDAAKSLNESGKVLADWLAFDWHLVEKRLWKLFSLAADKTRLQQAAFQRQIEHGPIYRAEEITGPGSLKCVACGHVVHFHNVSEIPVCTTCQQNEYTRLN
ncbi:hypothetical protein BH10PSE19_BH10PSE19_11510 [soil metagenome]